MKTILSTLAMYLLMMINGLAQSGEIKGRLFDSTLNKNIEGATISLLKNADKKMIKNVISNPGGLFVISNITNGEYQLAITHVGYKAISYSIKIDDNAIDLETIYLKLPETELKGITIIAKGAAVTQKDDTSQYNANQYKVNPDATTEDMIKKMPGITVDKNGTITAHGEVVKKVTVDGKDFFGDDASAALKNIPAAAVDKIQVYDRLSDQAQLTGIDDGNSQKSINIITKAGINDAQFGRIYAGFGTNNTYATGGNASFFKNDRRISLVGTFNNINQQNFGSQDMLGVTGNNNSRNNMAMGNFRGPNGPAETFTVDPSAGINSTNSFGVNYSDKWSKKSSISGSYFFNETRNDNLSNSNTFVFEGNQSIEKNSTTLTDNFNHRINARYEYKMDSNNIIFVIPSINLQINKSEGAIGLLSYLNNNDSLYNSNSYNNRKKNGYNIKNNLMFRHTFKNKNRIFSAGLNTTLSKNDGETTINGTYRFYDNFGLPIIPDSIQQQYSDNKTDGYTLGGTLTYNEPFGKKGKGQVQFEYNPTLQFNKSIQSAYNFDGQVFSKFDSTLSNSFNSSTTTHNGGITYRYTPSKDEQFAIGAIYQASTLSNEGILPFVKNSENRFSNFLPNGYWRKKLTKYSNFRMFFRTTVIFPTISQLQDVVNLTNPLSVSAGNVNLKQSLTRYMGGRFSYSNTKTNTNLFTGAFVQLSNNFISNATYITTSDSIIEQNIVLKKGTQFNKPINLDGYKIFRSYLNYSIPFKQIKSTINFTSSISFSKMPGLINYLPIIANNTQYNVGLALVSNVSQYVDYNISYNRAVNYTKTTGSNITKNNFLTQNISVVFNLLSKKGWFLQNDFSSQILTGLSGGFDQTFTLWNAGIGKKLFKHQTGEIKVSVFDILKQNQSISRNVTNTYFEDAKSRVLSQYYMLTFSYNLKNFGAPKKASGTEEFLPKIGYPNP